MPRRTGFRPGYHFDYHKDLVEQFHAILDKAAVEYDQDGGGDSGVLDDFNQYGKDWASERELLRPVRRNNAQQSP
jgi:hypothetical protein